jgi:peptidoglycan hydrolase-like protein with peptidoglycan-binding domain
MVTERHPKVRGWLEFPAAVTIIAALSWPLAGSAAAQQKTKQKQKRAAITSADIKEAEQLLSDLGYWGGPIDGRLDPATRHALTAFQKVEGRPPLGRLTRGELVALRGAKRPQARMGGAAHIEIDLTRQVLFVVEGDGKVSKILPVSSGNGEAFTSEGWTRHAITPTGRFKVHRKLQAMRRSPLGLLYYPVYYLDGIAIHGSPSVPARPASHGCVRIPMFAAVEFNEMTRIGMWVYVYDENTVLPGGNTDVP